MNTLAQRNSHRESILNTLLAPYANRVTHRHTRTEVGVGQSLRSKALHEDTNYRVASWIPSCRDYAHGICLFIDRHHLCAIVEDRSVDIEAINGVDTHGCDSLCIFWAATSRSSEDSNVYILQLLDIINYLILCQLLWLILIALTTNDASNFKIRCSLKSLNAELSNVAIANYGSSNLFHVLMYLCLVGCFLPFIRPYNLRAYKITLFL